MKLLIPLCCIFITTSLLAQEAEKTPMPVEVGLNTSFLFGSILDVNENEYTQNPYILTGKIGFGKMYARLGVGGKTKKTIESEEGFADSETTISNGLDLRIGVEFQKQLAKKWRGYVGFDLMGGLASEQTIQDSGFDKVTLITNSTIYGGGPIAGLQLDLNDALSLGTESLFYFKMGTTESARLFTNFPEFDDELGKTRIQEMQITLPSAIYIIYRF